VLLLLLLLLAGKKQLVRNSKDVFLIVMPFVFWACLVIFAYLLTILELKTVRGTDA
jgi:hypothetical protein